MSCTVCSVIPLDSNWVVECGGTSHGPYLSNDIALRVAIAEALAIRRQGQRATVLVQDGSGRSYAGYCLCADFKIAQAQADSVGGPGKTGEADATVIGGRDGAPHCNGR
jgi:hypothetical protein